MNVLIVTSTFPQREDDGMPRFVYDLAKAMSRQCRVTVLAPHAHGSPYREDAGQLTIRRFQYSWPARTQCLAYGNGMRQNARLSPVARMQIPAYMASLGWAVRTCLHRERFDVINSHWMVPQGLAVSLLRRWSAASVHAVTIHAGDLFLLERMAMGRRLARYVASHSDVALPVATHLAQRLQLMVGGTLPMAVEPMGVDVDRFAAPPGEDPPRMPFDGKFILFVGRLVEKKGVAFLLEAMRLLPDALRDTGLVVIGSGVLASELRRRARQLGLEARVRFVGSMDHPKMIYYLRGCAVVAVPSIVDGAGETEGMPTVLVEALAAGCKVVASRVAGIPDILAEGYNGWMAEPANAVDLAAKLAAALDKNVGDIRRNARETALGLDWPCIADRYLNHFSKHLAHPGRR
ncbi:MAG: glycosyltransferase [Desulfobacteraceae bacterium]|jgi:phosphatidyl-myo-inositol dimannoside synthase